MIQREPQMLRVALARRIDALPAFVVEELQIVVAQQETRFERGAFAEVEAGRREYVGVTRREPLVVRDQALGQHIEKSAPRRGLPPAAVVRECSGTAAIGADETDADAAVVVIGGRWPARLH